MNHIDLFSGIGGFSLAFDQVFHEQKNNHIFVEIDPFCQAVLKKHWPEAEIVSDIRQFAQDPVDFRRLHGGQKESSSIRDKRNAGAGNETGVYLLTGGFPCQPFSQAGRRKGTSDDRFLWPEMFRVIQATRPEWVIAENVRGLATWNDGLVLEQVCADLESIGYEVQPLIIPAVAVNAPHRRDRVWFIGHAKGSGSKAVSEVRKGESTDSTGSDSDASNTESRNAGKPSESKGRKDFDRRSWEANWLEVATSLCGVDDGLSNGLDFAGYTKAQHRVQRLKALGNAIVPAVAMEIMKAIKQSL